MDRPPSAVIIGSFRAVIDRPYFLIGDNLISENATGKGPVLDIG